MILERHLARLIANAPSAEALAPTAPPPALLGSTTWQNQLGSTLTISVGPNQSLSGVYNSAVSSGGNPVSGPVTGWFAQNTLCWSVLWPTNPPSMTSWVGEIANGSGQILTLWHLVEQTPNPGSPNEFWAAVNAGADTFTLT